MIITTYNKDGTKLRKPVGYAGQDCQRATEPYERREFSGQVHKVLTDDAAREPASEREFDSEDREHA
jgi:hypothetical protein